MNYTTTSYNWTVMSVNTETRSMVVSYEALGTTSTFNIPQLLAGNTLSEWVDRYSPRSLWMQQEYADVVSGETGTNELIDISIPLTTATLFSSDQITFLQNLITETVTAILSTSTNG